METGTLPERGGAMAAIVAGMGARMTVEGSSGTSGNMNEVDGKDPDAADTGATADNGESRS